MLRFRRWVPLFCSLFFFRSYRAPEVVLGLPYGSKVDVVSLFHVPVQVLGQLCFFRDVAVVAPTIFALDNGIGFYLLSLFFWLGFDHSMSKSQFVLNLWLPVSNINIVLGINGIFF